MLHFAEQTGSGIVILVCSFFFILYGILVHEVEIGFFRRKLKKKMRRGFGFFSVYVSQ